MGVEVARFFDHMDDFLNYRKSIYEIIAECPAFQSGDECINENNSLLIGIHVMPIVMPRLSRRGEFTTLASKPSKATART